MCIHRLRVVHVLDFRSWGLLTVLSELKGTERQTGRDIGDGRPKNTDAKRPYMVRVRFRFLEIARHDCIPLST